MCVYDLVYNIKFNVHVHIKYMCMSRNWVDRKPMGETTNPLYKHTVDTQVTMGGHELSFTNNQINVVIA